MEIFDCFRCLAVCRSATVETQSIASPQMDLKYIQRSHEMNF